jgi:uncharacterized protein (UPF0264 family)
VLLVKCGLAGWAGRDWAGRLAALRSPRLVATAYADHELACSPRPEQILETAIALKLPAFLLDTCTKTGRDLLAWMSRDRLARLIQRARVAGMPVALAGSLTASSMAALADLAPDWFAVRGAACPAGRESTVDADRVRELVTLLGT